MYSQEKHIHYLRSSAFTEHNAKEYKMPLVNLKCSKPCCGDEARLVPLLSLSRAQWPFCPRHEADLGRSWEGSLRALLPAWRAPHLGRPADASVGLEAREQLLGPWESWPGM